MLKHVPTPPLQRQRSRIEVDVDSVAAVVADAIDAVNRSSVCSFSFSFPVFFVFVFPVLCHALACALLLSGFGFFPPLSFWIRRSFLVSSQHLEFWMCGMK